MALLENFTTRIVRAGYVDGYLIELPSDTAEPLLLVHPQVDVDSIDAPAI